MKKKYEKPMVCFENFELSRHIAKCAWEWVENTSTNPVNCYAVSDEYDVKLFQNGNYNCDIDAESCVWGPQSDFTSLTFSS